MQNIQNTETQRVINLVDTYRIKVAQENKIAKEAQADFEYWEKINEERMLEAFEAGETFYPGIYPEESYTELWAKHLSVNEQLLGHFYLEYAGGNAEKEILDKLLPDFYDKTIFTCEEESFMLSHFKEMVNYIIQTPCNDLKYAQRYDSKDRFLIPEEILALIADRVKLPVEARIYNPFTGFGQFATIYKGRKFLCESDPLLAWQKIFFHANGIEAEIISDDNVPTAFDASVAYIPFLPEKYEKIKTANNGYIIRDAIREGYEPVYIAKVQRMYDNLNDGGKMLIITRKEYFWSNNGESPLAHLLKSLIENKSIIEIIQLPLVMCYGEEFVLLIAEKGQKHEETTMIDARETFEECENEHFPEKFDLDAFYALLDNSGKDPITGLRKIIKVPVAELDVNLLLPQVYVIERPSENDRPRPLSDFCTPISTKIYDVDIPADKQLPWVKLNDLSVLYHGALDLNKLEKIGEPEDVDKYKSFEQLMDHSTMFRTNIYVSGYSDTVVFFPAHEGMGIALINACDTSIAVQGLYVIQPKKGVDAETLLALIRMPIVHRQISTYKKFGLNNHLDDIIVPTDQRIIFDEKKRLEIEEKAYKTHEDKLAAQKNDYINEVRMRKHDMGQYIFELLNIEDLMRYYLDNREKEKDFCLEIGSLLDNFHTSLGELTTLLDNLSREEKFGDPFPIRIDEFISTIAQRHHNVAGFCIESYMDKDSVKKYEKKLGESFASGDDEFFVLPVVSVSPIDLQRMGNNIIDNAKKHGFTDAKRKDYVLKIIASIDVERNMYQIDFRNNGNPLPEGMNKMRYGIKGEKAGKTGGTGLGGNYVKSFVEHYGGDYDIFMEEGWTVVRICLPINGY